MRYKSLISVKGDSELISKVFASEDREINDKASYKIRKTTEGVTFAIEAEDSVGLRTVLNSITKVLTVIEKVKRISD